MHTLYDTETAPYFERYDYYRSAAAVELAPMAVHGRAPGRLSAAMSGTRFGDFEIEVLNWRADSEITARRTQRMIRLDDPEYYRIILGSVGEIRIDQAGHQVTIRSRDLALYDMSYPFQATHATGSGSMRVIMLTFPRSVVPIPRATVRPLVGALTPRSLGLRSLIAQFLIGLTEADGAADAADPGTADILLECVVGLIHQRLGGTGGTSPSARRALYLAHLRNIIRQHLGDPALAPGRIAAAANISSRYLHVMFEETGHTAMQLIKQLRLEACHRSLQDPSLHTIPVKDVIAMHGYRRPDQFARDYKRLFGVSATRTRRSAGQPA